MTSGVENPEVEKTGGDGGASPTQTGVEENNSLVVDVEENNPSAKRRTRVEMLKLREKEFHADIVWPSQTTFFLNRPTVGINTNLVSKPPKVS